MSERAYYDNLHPYSTWKHVETGSFYTVLGVARCSTNGEREGREWSVVYVSHTYGRLCYREVSEFLDGRFIPATTHHMVREEEGK